MPSYPLGQIPGYWLAYDLPTLALSITSFAGLQPNHKRRTIRRTAPGLYPDSTRQGLPENRVFMFMLSAMRSILITLLGFELAGLLSGAFIAEFFFNWPGLGRLILQAVLAQDLYLVMQSGNGCCDADCG